MLAWIAGGLVLAIGAFVAGSFVRSPWEDAVENSTATLEATVVLAERDFAADTVVVTGPLALGEDLTVAAPEAENRAVISGVFSEPGEAVQNGDLLVTVSGRPLFALPLQIPLYRDLEPTMTGPDVESLQRALKDVGLYAGAIDGDYGPGTSAAVKRLYSRSGQAPPAPITEERATSANETGSAATADSGASSTGAGAQSGSGDGSGTAASTPTLVELGTPLPMDEVVDVPSGGSTVLGVAALGSVLEPGGTVMTLRSGEATITTRVPVVDAEAFALGTPMTVTIPGAGTPELAGSILSVSAFLAGDTEGTLPGYDVVVGVDPTHLEGVTAGAVGSVAPSGSGESTRGLAIPLAALREDSAGNFVLLSTPDRPRVDVTVGLQSDGYAQVLDPQGLEVGTTVVIGG